MIRIVTAALVLLIVAIACGGDGSSPTPSAEEERILALIGEERTYVEAVTPTNDAEEGAKQSYVNRLEIFELGVMTSANVVYDFCSAGLLVERQALAGRRAEFPDASYWDRYEPLLDEIEAFLCPERDALTLVGDRYIGPIGDFLVNEGDSLDGGPPCSASRGEFEPTPTDVPQSELWSDVFSENAQPNLCADDDRLLAIFEYTDEAIVRRAYFYTQPLPITFNVLRAEPELLEIEGHPAIVGVDELPSQQVYLYAIERFPAGDTPGIAVFVLGLGEGVERATELAAELLR